MSVNKVLFLRKRRVINGRVRIWNNIILLHDQLEPDIHRNDRQVWYF